MRFATMALMSVPLLMPSTSATAQPVTTFEDLGLRVDLGDRAHISLPGGGRFSGRVVDLTRDAIEIESSAGRRRFVAAEVGRVEVSGDSLRNGAVIGLASGALFGGLFASGFSDHPSAGDVMVGAAIFGGIGAGIGLGIDALIRGNRLVYRAAPPRASLVPVITPRAVGLTAAFRW